MSHDVIVVGGGPGGYVAAIRAAQLGGKVAIIEQNELGGVCLNQGCIPTKTLLTCAEKWRDLQNCANYGLKAENIYLDYSQVLARKSKVVLQLRSGVEQLIKSNGIEVLYGQARLQADGSLLVTGEANEVRVEGRAVIMATGSSPADLTIPGGELPAVINSDQLLALSQLPRSLAVIGAGAVGIEFASIFQAFGVQVTVIEMLPTILPNLDSDIIKRAGLALRKQGLSIMTNAKVTNIQQNEQGLKLTVDNGKELTELVVEKVLKATGRCPNIAQLGLEAAGVTCDRQGIPVNGRMETNVPGLYAVGDVTGRFMWAHAASSAGMIAAENAMGGNAVFDDRAVPGSIFITPEIAGVGLTEQEAGPNICVSRFNFAANGKAVSMGNSDGLVKIIADAEDHRVLGMHIVGPHASDLILEGGLAIRNRLTANDIARTIHPHPTLSEAVMEAAQGIGSTSIHQVRVSG
ncbi:MAG: dihydrolipoamide dehydrogenase [Firmicutes bacterium]|nr:dihydrolipoamide dehydrogenase [Bacillota bacterium]